MVNGPDPMVCVEVGVGDKGMGVGELVRVHVNVAGGVCVVLGVTVGVALGVTVPVELGTEDTVAVTDGEGGWNVELAVAVALKLGVAVIVLVNVSVLVLVKLGVAVLVELGT